MSNMTVQWCPNTSCSITLVSNYPTRTGFKPMNNLAQTVQFLDWHTTLVEHHGWQRGPSSAAIHLRVKSLYSKTIRPRSSVTYTTSASPSVLSPETCRATGSGTGRWTTRAAASRSSATFSVRPGTRAPWACCRAGSCRRCGGCRRPSPAATRTQTCWSCCASAGSPLATWRCQSSRAPAMCKTRGQGWGEISGCPPQLRKQN